MIKNIEDLDFNDIIAALRKLKNEAAESKKKIRELEKELKKYRKILSDDAKQKLDQDKLVRQEELAFGKKVGGKQKWVQLKEQWADLNPDFADLPDRISDALHSWKVPFRGYIHGNSVLQQCIDWSQNEEKGIPPREIYNIITLMSRVDFNKYTEFVPTIRATEHITSKFEKFREFFERERIYYYPNGSSEYKLDDRSFKEEYRSK